MHIEHFAIWTKDLERLRRFYERYFNAVAGAKYVNEKRGFASCFLAFECGARLELMTIAGVTDAVSAGDAPVAGYAHLAMALGSTTHVDELTNALRSDGYPIIGEPRWTGDGYYESVVLDPDGNQIELTV